MQYLQALLALLFVLGLIGLLSFVLRKYSFSSPFLKKIGATEKSLSIEEILPVDAKRRLLLVKRGKTKHLLLLGINGDILIEGNIKDEA